MENVQDNNHEKEKEIIITNNDKKIKNDENKENTKTNENNIQEVNDIEPKTEEPTKTEEPKKIEYNFCLATKMGNKPELMPKFTKSPAYKSIVDFLYSIQGKIIGMKRSDVKQTTNECLVEFDNLYLKLEELYKKHPPKEGEARYDDPVFKRYYDDLEKDYDNIMTSTILKSEKTPKNLILELKSYFMDSFGNPYRFDYGTGHELNYLCFLFVLFKAGMYTSEDFPFLALNVFYKYIVFMRKLQINYILEPAGARGVWGLDEYQFIPFIFGASQLIDNNEITPKGILDDNILKNYKNEYIYLDCVDYIKSVKSGASFAEYAPILESITNAKNWSKIANGLVKMYQDDVLKKYVIIQHFYFGSVLVIE